MVSDIISGTADQDGGMVVCANFGYSRLMSSEASFSTVFLTSITSDRKYIVTSYPVSFRADNFVRPKAVGDGIFGRF